MTLKDLFDFQRFANNEKLNALIQDTQSRLPSSLSEEELSFVNAAGVPEIMGYKEDQVHALSNRPSRQQ